MGGEIDANLGKFGVSDVVSLLGRRVVRVSGSTARSITSLRSLSRAAPGSLVFCRHTDSRLDAAVSTPAAAIIVPSEPTVHAVDGGPTLIAVDNPRLAFIRVAAHLFGRDTAPGIHPTVVIDASAAVDATASIGPFSVIGPRCSIGAGSAIGAHVVLRQDVRIGANSRVEANCVIGSEGFGFERDEDGKLLNFPHIGGVVIGDGVDIGCYVSIDRGTLDDTVIGNGVRIDDLVHISHNCQIGADAVVTGLVGIGGSSRLGEQAWIAPGVQVLNQLSIGPRAHLGIGSVVVKDVAEGQHVFGNPAKRLPGNR